MRLEDADGDAAIPGRVELQLKPPRVQHKVSRACTLPEPARAHTRWRVSARARCGGACLLGAEGEMVGRRRLGTCVCYRGRAIRLLADSSMSG